MRRRQRPLPAGSRALCAAAAVLFAAAPARAATTHYWTWHKAPTQGQLAACAEPMRKLAAARSEVIALDTPAQLAASTTELGPSLLSFNGNGDFRQEQFRWPGRRGFNFCKTLGFPYDEVVTAALIAARDCFGPGQLAIGTDGEWEEWAPGAHLYEAVLGKKALSPISGDVQQPEAEVTREAVQATGLLVKRETVDLLPGALLFAFLALFFLDRFRTRRT